MKSYIEANCIFLSRMTKDNLVVYHVYSYDKNETVLLYSVSDFRDSDVDQNLAGRANKLMHYKDMCLFKNMQLQRYDWGNIANPVHPNGIDNFKLSFGGDIHDKYNILIGLTFKGNLAVDAYRLIHR